MQGGGQAEEDDEYDRGGHARLVVVVLEVREDVAIVGTKGEHVDCFVVVVWMAKSRTFGLVRSLAVNAGVMEISSDWVLWSWSLLNLGESLNRSDTKTVIEVCVSIWRKAWDWEASETS